MRVCLAAAWLISGCAAPPILVSSDPIPVSLVGGKGGLVAQGQVGEGSLFSLLVDTGTVLTAHSTPGSSRLLEERLRLLDRGGVARAEFPGPKVLETPLGSSGVDARTIDLSNGGILGGDLLSGYSVAIDYAAPSLVLGPPLLGCSCALADQCAAVLPFALTGGGTWQLGDEIHTYPPTRVAIDVCLAPRVDPLKRGVPCVQGGTLNIVDYEVTGKPGVDARLLLATGFPSLLLGASAWDRLQGPGKAGAALAGASSQVYFPGRSQPVKAARANLGEPGMQRAALALVSRLGLLGPCGELARSRRLRAFQAQPLEQRDPKEAPDCRAAASDCPPDKTSCLQCLKKSETLGAMCKDAHGIDRCNDRNQPAAAFVEIDDPIEVYIVDDAAPILQEINFDTHPALPAIEGIAGTELLARLALRVDYPNRRLVAHCASPSGCSIYPAYGCPNTTETEDCGRNGQDAAALCHPPSAIPPAGATPGPVCLGR